MEEFFEADVTDEQHDRLSALMRCAIGKQSIPDIEKFNCLFNEQQDRQPLSTEEKVQGLEVLGSTHILRQEFAQGLNCWERAMLLRSSPRTPLPEADLPPISSKFFKQECTTFTLNSIDLYDTILNSIYQAMLVRLRYCRSEIRSDVSTLFTLIGDLNRKHNIVFLDQLVLLLFEWDELYASHSLSLDTNPYMSFFLTRVCANFTMAKLIDSADEISFDRVILILKWLATDFENAKARNFQPLKQEHFVLLDLSFELAALCITIISDMKSLTGKQQFEFRMHLRRVVESDWRNSKGRSILLHRVILNISKTESLERIVRLLIEAGADVNSTDNDGKNCLQYLIEDSSRTVIDLPTLQLLMNCGARWHEVMTGKNDNLLKEFRKIWRSSFPSLQWLCATVLRRNRIPMKPDEISRTLIDMVNDY